MDDVKLGLIIREAMDGNILSAAVPVAGTATFSSGRPNRKIVRVVAQLRWFTKGRGSSNKMVAEEQILLSEERTLPLSLDFSFKPPLNPLSYKGKYFSINWGLEFKVYESRFSRQKFKVGLTVKSPAAFYENLPELSPPR